MGTDTTSLIGANTDTTSTIGSNKIRTERASDQKPIEGVNASGK
jgi:hypothetical protein